MIFTTDRTGRHAFPVYLDNAATSFPKPPSVIRAVEACLERYGGNPGRGCAPPGRYMPAVSRRRICSG